MRVCVLHILPDIAQGWDISVELNPSHPESPLLDPDKIMLVEVQHHASSVTERTENEGRE